MRWNQSNIGGLFVYCQNIISKKNREAGLWEVPASRKADWRWEAAPYRDYLEYILQKDILRIQSQKKVYSIEKYLVKFLGKREMEGQDKTSGKGLTRKRSKSDHSLTRALMQFALPWMR